MLANVKKAAVAFINQTPDHFQMEHLEVVNTNKGQVTTLRYKHKSIMILSYSGDKPSLKIRPDKATKPYLTPINEVLRRLGVSTIVKANHNLHYLTELEHTNPPKINPREWTEVLP